MSLENLSEEELQDIAENITEEEFDQLDEISKRTLGSYIRKAADSHANRSLDGDAADMYGDDYRIHDHKANNRLKGIKRAIKRFPGKEKIGNKILKNTDKLATNKINMFHDRDGPSNTDDEYHYNHTAERDYRDRHTAKNRDKIDKNVSKLTKEEFDQLDELSKRTLGNYIRASADAHANHSLDGEAADTYGDDWEEHEHKEKNRLKGINRAIKRFPGKEKIGNKILKNTKSLSRNKSDLFHDRDGPSNTNEPYHYNHTAERDYENYDTEHSRRKIDKNVSKLTREDIYDLISTAIDKRPINFAEKFNDILVDKIEEAIEYKKYQVAESLYGAPDDYNNLYLEDIDIDLDLEDYLFENDGSTIDKYGSKVWYNKSGQLHRDGDKPAKITNQGDKKWYQNGKLHRDGDKPAVHDSDGYKEWHKQGQLHRDGDKPSRTDFDGTRYWHKHGKLYKTSNITEEEFDQLDELSKKTLGSYIKKSARAHANHGLDYLYADDDDDDVKPHERKIHNRMKGINSALKKIPGKDEDKKKVKHHTTGLSRDKEDTYGYDDFNRYHENRSAREHKQKIDQYVDKLTKENFDLQELARETMTSDLIKKGHKESDLKKMKYSEVRDRYMNHDYNNSK